MRIFIYILFIIGIISCSQPKKITHKHSSDYDSYTFTHKSLIDLEGYEFIDGKLVPEAIDIAVLDTTSVFEKFF